MIPELLAPYVAFAPAETDWPRIHAQLATYLDLILKWNARVNLTAIRSPEEIVRRHFGESLFAGLQLGPCESLLDFGSGAGFPGIPIQLLRPELSVTLAESRAKKAAFLQEVIRTLGLSTEVWPKRVEDMPTVRQFDTVALRAVDNMAEAIRSASLRAQRRLLILGTAAPEAAGFTFQPPIPLPNSKDSAVWIGTRL